MSRFVLVLWMLALSAVILYVGVFVVLAGKAPFEVQPEVTIAVVVLGVLFTLRSLRIGRELRDRAGDPQLRADYNRARERRGF